jgi:hypothetical protein
MKWRRWGYDFRNSCTSYWHEHKKLLIVLGLFILAGIGVGIFVAFNPLVNSIRITRNLLDGNIINTATQDRSLFAFLAVRFLDVFFFVLLVFLFNLSKWTWLLTFPYLSFRAFWAVINLYWIVNRFGFIHGLLFFVVYLIVFLVLLCMLAFACIFIIKKCQQIRAYGFRSCIRWREIGKPIFWFTLCIAFIALVEWFMYFMILARLIYTLN